MAGRRPDDRGQILVGVAIIALVVMVALSTMAMALITSVGVSARTADDTTATDVAQSGLGWFYSQLELCPNWLDTTGSDCPDSMGSWPASPAYSAPGTSGASVPWVQLGPTGQVQLCTGSACLGNDPSTGQPETSFQITATVQSGDYTQNNPVNGTGISGYDQVQVLATGRTDCRGSASQCVETSYQTIMRRRAYLDYLYFTNYETLAPELYGSGSSPPSYTFNSMPSSAGLGAVWSVVCDSEAGIQANCIYPAYQASSSNLGDTIDGPVFTNSAQVFACGTPVFDYPVEATGSPQVVQGEGCSLQGAYTAEPPSKQVPLPTDDSDLADIACGQAVVSGICPIGSSPWYITPAADSATQILGNGDGTVDVDGTNAGTPTNGVIFVNGPAEVSGSFSLPVTIATALGYNIIVNGSVCAPDCGATPDVPVGLIAGNDVVLYDPNYNSSTSSNPWLLSVIAGVGGGTATNPVTPVGGDTPTSGAQPDDTGINGPAGIAFDKNGDMFIADASNNLVEEVTPGPDGELADGTLSVIAGVGGVTATNPVTPVGGDTPTSGIPATSAELNYPDGVAVDPAGDLLIADWGNSLVEEVTPGTNGFADGTLTVVAGVGGVTATNPVTPVGGDTPTSGATPTETELNNPAGVAVDSNGDLLIADYNNNVVEEVIPGTNGLADGTLSVIAGVGGGTATNPVTPVGGNTPTVGATPTETELSAPDGVAVDSNGDLFIPDYNNNVVEEIVIGANGLVDGTLSVIAGVGTGTATPAGGDIPTVGQNPAVNTNLEGPSGVAVSSAGNLFISDSGRSEAEEVTPGTNGLADGILSVVAGGGSGGTVPVGGSTPTSDIPAISASLSFQGSGAVAVDPDGNFYIADYYNNVVEQIIPPVPSNFEVDAAMMSLGQPLDGLAITSSVTMPNGDQVPTTCPADDPNVSSAESNSPSYPGCGTVYLYQWTTAPIGATSPELIIQGAMISQYRGVFGTYDSTGMLVSGEYKNFSWDSDLLQQQPPYFLEPTYAEWTQTGTQGVGTPQTGSNP